MTNDREEMEQALDSNQAEPDSNSLPSGKSDLPPWEKEMQKLVPEAVASVTYQLKTPNGFECLYTKRHFNDEKLLGEMMALEMDFIQNGYEPQGRSYKKKKGQRTTAGPKSSQRRSQQTRQKNCPQCGAPAKTRTSKDGRKYEVCTENEYGEDTGCDYFRWLDANNSSGQGSGGSQSRGRQELATSAQRNLIQEQWPRLWRNDLTKSEAYKIINERINK